MYMSKVRLNYAQCSLKKRSSLLTMFSTKWTMIQENKLPVLICLQNLMCLCVSELALSRSGLDINFINNQACFRLSTTSFYFCGIQNESVNFNKIIQQNSSKLREGRFKKFVFPDTQLTCILFLKNKKCSENVK